MLGIDQRSEEPDGGGIAPGGGAPALALHALHGPTEAVVGERIALEGPVELGRAALLPSEGRDDRVLSRRHARFFLEGASVVIEDLGSSNGTFVNGRRIERAVLREGDVVELGTYAFLVVAVSSSSRPSSNSRFVGCSARLGAFVEALAVAAPSADWVLVTGPPGIGKSLAVEELHRISGRAGPLVVVPCNPKHAPGGATPDLAALLAAASSGTLLLDALELASPPLALALAALLEPSLPGDVRLVASSRLSREELARKDGLPEALVSRFTTHLSVPPLELRREDIPLLIRHFFAPLGPEGPELTRDFIAKAVQNTPFRENVRELFTRLDGCFPTGDSDSLVFRGDDNAVIGIPRFATSPPRVKIAIDGSFVEVARERLALRGRRALRGVLCALVSAARGSPGLSVPVSALLLAGWPGERVLLRSGASRVYSAISTLRRMGIGAHLERTQVGYRLLHPAAIEFVEPQGED